MAKYLNIDELAALLEISSHGARRRLKREPWNLPPPAHLGPGFPLRWREAEVKAWLYEHRVGVLTTPDWHF